MKKLFLLKYTALTTMVVAPVMAVSTIAAGDTGPIQLSYDRSLFLEDKTAKVSEYNGYLRPYFTNIVEDVTKYDNSARQHLLSDFIKIHEKFYKHNALAIFASKWGFIRPTLTNSFMTNVPKSSVINLEDLKFFFNEHSSIFENNSAFENTKYVKIKDDLYINAFDLVMLKEWTSKIPGAMKLAYWAQLDVFNAENIDNTYTISADNLDIYAKIENGKPTQAILKGCPSFYELGLNIDGKIQELTFSDNDLRPILIPHNYGDIYLSELAEVFKGVNHTIEFEFNYKEKVQKQNPDWNTGNVRFSKTYPSSSTLIIDGITVLKTRLWE